jgi:hypothetical protein
MTQSSRRPRREHIAPSALLQAMFEAASETRTMELEFRGERFEVRWRPLPWLAKSRCVSAATVYEATPEGAVARFRLDVYLREALKEMIVEAPFPITDQVLSNLPEEVGSRLGSIVPDPFADAGMEAAGKGSGSSSGA